MDLILWRHAEAEDTARGSDLARPLTARGRAQAARMAAWLRARLPGDARVLASPARRCQETVAALAGNASTVVAIGPGATAEALLQAAGWPGAGATVLVVAHQPTIGAAAALAMGAPGASWHVAKGAVWWLVGANGGSVRLRAVCSPDDLP
jgi:phosphohistidine phosphatase